MHAPARYRSSVTEAKRDTQAVPDSETSEREASEQPIEPTDPKARFKAALDRKNATPGTHPGSQADGGTAMKSSNGKKKREFRRKAGG
jgi:hypothetical protein